MSRYGYDYSITPNRPSGWRSAFTSILLIGTVVAVSAVSGAVVTLDLLGPANSGPDRPLITATATTHPAPTSIRVATPSTPKPHAAIAPAHKAAAVAPPPVAAPAATPAQPTSHPISQPAVAPAPQPSTPAAVASVDEPETASIPDRELTFTQGYARRRAMQEAATTGSGAKTGSVRVASQSQIGRAAKAKPRMIARQNTLDQRRFADARDQGAFFSRFDQSNRSDYFAHHQALAYGDPRANQTRRAPSQQGGMFGGFFRGGLF